MSRTLSCSIVFDDPPISDGLRVIQGVQDRHARHDRTVLPTHTGGQQCVTNSPTMTPRREMGYWRGTQVDKPGSDNTMCLKVENSPTDAADAWLVFEFYESTNGWIGIHFERDGAGFVHHVCTHDQELPWEHSWVNTAATSTWQRATVPLTAARFAGAGPLGCDVEIEGSGPLHIRSVAITTNRPDDADETNLDAHARRIRHAIGANYAQANEPVSVGNIGSIWEDGDLGSARDVAPWLPVYHGLGVTSIQSYVRWSYVEQTEGVWDWGIYDWTVDLAKRFDMKWVAFIMIGPFYAMPKWWLEAGNDYRNRCLEHDEDSWVQSIWSPVMLDAVDRFMKQFSDHYDHDIVESIMLGIAGDFGESTTNGVFTKDLYHTHVGHWCGEEVAVENFRKVLAEKYPTVDSLNDAWGTAHSSFDEIVPVLREDAASDRAWLDEVNWYVDRMTWWMMRWSEITAEALPTTVVYNAAGGAGDPPRAASWSAQSKAMAHTGVGHRVTNEGADFAFNFAYTSWTGTCCRFYDLPFGNEPWGGDMCGAGDLGRIFNAVTQNATNYWFYDGHIRPAAGQLALQRGLPFINGKYRRSNRVAVYYPWTHFLLKDDHGFAENGRRRDLFWPQIEELRDLIDFDLVDPLLIEDGILSEYDYVIILQGSTYESDELERLAVWVESGGVIITHDLGVPGTVEGDLSIGARLLGLGNAQFDKDLDASMARVGKGATAMYPHRADWVGWRGDDRWKDNHHDHPSANPAFWRMVVETLANASKLGANAPDYPIVDGVLDEVFAAIVDHSLEDGNTERGVMYFSQVEKDVVVTQRLPGGARREVTVPAGQLIFEPI